MLVIRLQRTGRRNMPTYRVVVAERSMAVKGKCKEIVGHYLPTREPVTLTVNEERIRHWISHGAAPSDTVARLLRNKGMDGLEKFIVSYAKQKSKKGAEGGETVAPSPGAPAAAAPAAPAGDAHKEDGGTVSAAG